TNQETRTDGRGQYSLTVPGGARTLVCRSIGHRTLEVAIEGRSVIDVALEPAALTMDEVLVMGYTNQRRKDVSDATASVTGEQIRGQQTATLEEALRGRVAGGQLSASGEPGRRGAGA